MKEIESVIGMVIKFLSLTDDCFRIGFNGNVYLAIWDNSGQQCCEARYMTTDDNLKDYIGATFLGVNVKPVEEETKLWGDIHEMIFVDICTSKGNISVCTHNEHNGWYGGLSVRAELVSE